MIFKQFYEPSPATPPTCWDPSPVAVYCGSGYRSLVAASLLKRRGHQRVVNVIGRFSAWQNDELKVQKNR